MKITELTKDQELLLEEVKRDWINFSVLDGDELDEKQAREGIEWLYRISGLQKPITIIVDSPLGVQYGVYYARELLKALKIGVDGHQIESQVWGQVGSQVGRQVWGQVWGQVRGQVESRVESQVWGQVGRQVEGQVRGQVESQVGRQVESQVWSQVWSQVRGQVESQVGRQVWSQVGRQVESQVWSQVESQGLPYESFAGDTLAYWASWGAWAEVFEKLGVVKHSDYKKYKRHLRSGVFMGVYLDGLAVVCRRPKATHRDNNFNLHSDQLPALEWRDGYKLYALHGVFFDEPLWRKIVEQKLTLTDIAKIGDADKSAVAIQMLRPDRLLKQVGAKLINTGKKGTRLYEVKNFMDTGDTEYCMRMEHPTIKGKEYIEWVEPGIGKQKDADLAQANAFGIPLEDYLMAIEA